VAANQKATRKTPPDGSVGPQSFRSVTAIIVWWAWVLFAVGNLIDLAVQGRDHLSVVAAAILLLVTGIAYVTAERPRVISDDDGITVRNPLRDHRIPWPLVVRVDLADLLRVHCRRPGEVETDDDTSTHDASTHGKNTHGKKKSHRRIISAWAVHYSRRRQLTSEVRARRQSTRTRVGTTPFGVPTPSYASKPARVPDSSPEAEAERIARLLNDRATAAGIEQATTAAEQPATGTGSQGRVVSTWSWQALAALVVPVLILVIVALA
jgi:hypothetical protein